LFRCGVWLFRPAVAGMLPPQAPQPPGSDVGSFLDNAGLGLYKSVFFSHGYTTMAAVQSLRVEDMERLLVKPAHQKKLQAALDGLRSGRGMQANHGAVGSQAPPPQAPPPPPPQSMAAMGALPSMGGPGGVYSQMGASPWLDSPTAAAIPAAAPQQDMVFQWVDLPPRLPAQSPAYSMQAQPVAPAATYGYLGTGLGRDPYAMPARPEVGALPPQGMDPYGRQLGPAAQRYPRHEDYSGGSYQLFDHQRGAWGNRKGDGKGKGSRQGDDYGSRNRTRQQDSRGRQAGHDADQSNGIELSSEKLKEVLVSSLESLYEDRIKPLANYVKGRLKEKSAPESVTKNFVEFYAKQPEIFEVQRPTSENEEAIVFLKTEPTWFKGWVDIDSPDDPYEEVTWEALAKFLDGEHAFAGGRYGMARELMQRNLDFLKGHSLGEVCHIVQLAIQTRKLIVYHRKMLKPIQTVLCQMQPDDDAANGEGVPDVGADDDAAEITTMDDLCVVLFKMLQTHPQGLRLCRLKQMIKHEFQRKLSEMTFRCTKLIELFNTEPLTGTFVLDTENDGKSIYVRLGDPATFPENVQALYTKAKSRG